jgi:hypothetical protein
MEEREAKAVIIVTGIVPLFLLHAPKAKVGSRSVQVVGSDPVRKRSRGPFLGPLRRYESGNK